MSELNQKQVDQRRRSIAIHKAGDMAIHPETYSDLLDAAETLLALSWINNLYCPDCARWNECDCDEDRQACAFWATTNREELLALYRSREE